MAIQLSGLASGIDTGSMIEELMKAERLGVKKLEDKKLKSQWQNEVWKEMNTKLYDFYKKSVFNFKSMSSYSKKKLTNTNESLLMLSNSAQAPNGSHTISISGMAAGSHLTGHKLDESVKKTTTMAELVPGFDTGTRTINLKSSASGDFDASNEITIESTDTVDDVLKKIEGLDIGIKAQYDSNYNRIYLSTEETGADVQIAFDTSDTGASDVMSALGFSLTDEMVGGEMRTANAVGSEGASATFMYNGVEYTSETNDVNINGLSFTIKEASGTTTIGVTQDTDAIYDGIKQFVDDYNDLIKEINSKLGAESTRKYDMLSKEDKLSMTKEEIEMYEKKIKDSLLRRDDTLETIQRSMREILNSSIGVEFESGDNYKFLSDLGIVTGNFEEKGLLHIMGDDSDTAYANKPDRLREAIEKDPEGIQALFTKVGNALYSDLADKMKATKTSSALTFYDDKAMSGRMKDYEKEISKMEERLERIEKRYVAQFAAMEKAIQKSNSTGNWLAQQLGVQ